MVCMALERKLAMLDDLNMADNTKITYKRSFNKLFDFCADESQIENSWYKLATRTALADGKLAYQNESYENYLKLSDDTLQDMLESFLDFEKKRVKDNVISPNTIPNYYTAYKMLLEANYREHAVKWKPIVMKYPPMEKRSGYKPWTTTQINKMVRKCANLKKEAAVLLQSSTGSRVGVHDHPLLMRHMIKMGAADLVGVKDAPTYPYDYHCYGILIYADEGETIEEKDQRILNDERDSKDYSFFAFANPEAAYAIDQYHNQRRKLGENLLEQSPIIRGSDTHKYSTGEFYQFSGNAFRKMMEALVVQADIGRTKKRNRFDVMIDHGYRKRFNTILKIDNEINSNIAEKLMQHAKGLDGTYLTPTRQQCFAEFVKAIPELTVDDKIKEQMENQRKQEKIDELQEKNQKLEEQNQEIKKLKQRQIDFEKKIMENSFPGITE